MTFSIKKGAAVAAIAFTAAGLFSAPASATTNRAVSALPAATMSAKASSGHSAAWKRYHSECPTHHVCLWQSAGATGHRWVGTTSHTTMGWWNNRVTSVFNRSSTWYMCFYNRTHYRGWWYGGKGKDIISVYIGPGEGGTVPKKYNNTFSSFTYAKSANGCLTKYRG